MDEPTNHLDLGAIDWLESWLDLRQSRLSNLIDLIVQNHGELSRRKRKLFEDIADDELARIEAVVRDEFAEYLERHGSR